MRIISGKFKSRKLISPPTNSTRPTSDRARESIFNIINSLQHGLIAGAQVLDACAGTGALGLEALSRGAAFVTFIEKDRRTAQTIKANISMFNADTQCKVIESDVLKVPKSVHPMDLLFFDPPYDQIIEDPCLTFLHDQGWINDQTLIILETSAKRELQLPPKSNLISQRRYGVALISFLTFPS